MRAFQVVLGEGLGKALEFPELPFLMSQSYRRHVNIIRSTTDDSLTHIVVLFSMLLFPLWILRHPVHQTLHCQQKLRDIYSGRNGRPNYQTERCSVSNLASSESLRHLREALIATYVNPSKSFTNQRRTDQMHDIEWIARTIRI